MTEKDAVPPLHVLTVGIESQVSDRLAGYLVRDGQLLSIKRARVEDLLDGVQPEPRIIFCGPPEPGLSIPELAQMLRMNYQKVPIYYISLNYEAGYNRKEFKRNGFTDAFLFSMDQEILDNFLKNFFNSGQSADVNYRPVKLIDINPETVLDFATSIYLPKNNRYIGFSGAGDPMDQKRAARLKEHKHTQLFIEPKDLGRFYDYSAKILSSIQGSKTLGATERRERAETAVRDLFSGLLVDDTSASQFGQGRTHWADCQEIVKKYVKDTPQGAWYQRILSALGDQKTTYSHAVNVSTYATLFSIGLQVGDPEVLAIAGILHDIGLVKVPLSVQEIPQNKRSPLEQKAYEMHVHYTIELIKERKMILPEKVMLSIAQQHENHNGTGYPAQLEGHRICPEAEILAIADAFDEITSVQSGAEPLTAVEALQHFKKQMDKPSSRLIYNPGILRRILKLFPEENE